MKDNADLLKKGLEEIGIPYSPQQIESFRIYSAELKKWGRAFNLTGLKTDIDIILKHFLDSILFMKVIPANIQQIADVGSGAGFPGIPLKILNPSWETFLVEPTQKKAIFLRHICHTLKLSRIEIIDKRIEDIEELKVDVAVTRALFSVRDFIEKTKEILQPNGLLVLSKGPKLSHELQGLAPHAMTVSDFCLPFDRSVRHLVVVKP